MGANSGRIATTAARFKPEQWAEKWGCCAPLPGGELGPRLTQCRLGQGLPAYHVAS